MKTITSQDGTIIAYDCVGQGPALLLIGGALNNRGSGAELAGLLAPNFSVYTVDRRGRGDSGDTPPYVAAREVEDLQALVNEAGGSVFLYGHSSGAVLCMDAANTFPDKIKKLALYEPPFAVDDSRVPVAADYVAHLNELVAEGRRGDAVEYFLTSAVQMPPEFVAQMRKGPGWSSMEAVAHTIAYDGMIMGDTMSGKPLPATRWTKVTMPTLVMDGGNSPTWMHHAVQAAAKILPHAQHRTVEGQTHAADPKLLAPILQEFFLG